MTPRDWTIVKWSGIAAVVLLIVAIPFFGGRPQPLTRERYDAALARWSAAGIRNYDMDVETTGAQTGRYHIEVRDGQLRSIQRNGQPADPAAGEYWTVEGLFRIIEQDLLETERDDAGYQTQMWLFVRFHSDLGYPERYVRNVKAAAARSASGIESTGSTVSVEISVHKLELKS